jgi:anti-sigma regulatory factor (Ser/Thr protein kinase)
MSATETLDGRDGHLHGGYRHEAFFYAGSEQFIDGTLSFIRDGIANGEPTFVVLAADKIAALQERLGEAAGEVMFADMADVGANPAHIIPAWEDFVARYATPDRRLRGIGEPIWAERSPAELAECERHEALLNVVFSDPAFTLLCPYDTDALPDEVIDEARRNHPFLTQDGVRSDSAQFPGPEALALPFDEPLSEPPPGTPTMQFDADALREVRAWVADHAVAAGLSRDQTADLVLAANEIATNSLVHAGGEGTLRLWREEQMVICEVRDTGRITDPLAGRRRPGATPNGGRGLWIANRACDLVQMRTFKNGGAVRLHMRAEDGSA